MKKERGITLVALVITIIVMLIIASIGIYFATTELLIKAKYSKFIDEMAKVKENITMKSLQTKIDEMNGQIDSLFSAVPTVEEWNSVNAQLKYEMLYNRDRKAGTAGDKLPTRQYYGDITFETEKDEAGNDTGNIKDIFYVDKELTNKDEKAYLYDKQSSEVYRVEPEIIEGVPAYSNGLGNLLIGNSGFLQQIKEEISKVESKKYLYFNGNEYENITGGYIKRYNASNSYLSKLENSLKIYATRSGGGNSSILASTGKAINLQGYTKLVVKYKLTYYPVDQFGKDALSLVFGLGANPDKINNDEWGYITYPDFTVQTGNIRPSEATGEIEEKIIDISQITEQELYMQIYAIDRQYTGSCINCDIYEIYLE